MHNVLSTEANIVEIGFLCPMQAVLGSQGIVIK